MKLFIVTMQTGADLFTDLVWAIDFDDACFTAEIRFDGVKVLKVRRAA